MMCSTSSYVWFYGDNPEIPNNKKSHEMHNMEPLQSSNIEHMKRVT